MEDAFSCWRSPGAQKMDDSRLLYTPHGTCGRTRRTFEFGNCVACLFLTVACFEIVLIVIEKLVCVFDLSMRSMVMSVQHLDIEAKKQVMKRKSLKHQGTLNVSMRSFCMSWDPTSF